MPLWIQTLDQILLSFLSFEIPPFLVIILNSLGNIKGHLLLSLVGLSFIYRFKKAYFKSFILFFLNLSTLFAILYILKVSVIRLRPEFKDLAVSGMSFHAHLFDNRFHSFPSSHSALMGFYLEKSKFNVIILIFTLLMGISRIVTLQHYPSDVLCGISTGIAISYLFPLIYGKFFQKKKKANS